MKILPDLRKPKYRLTNSSGQHVEGNEFSDAKAAVNYQFGANIQGHRSSDLADQLNALTGDIAEIGDAEAGGDISRQLFLPSSLHLRLNRHRFERFNAGDAFHQEGLVFCAASKFLI